MSFIPVPDNDIRGHAVSRNHNLSGQAMVLLHGATNYGSAHYCVVLELKNDSSDKLMLDGGKTIYHVFAAFLFMSNKRDGVTNELKF